MIFEEANNYNSEGWFSNDDDISNEQIEFLLPKYEEPDFESRKNIHIAKSDDLSSRDHHCLIREFMHSKAELVIYINWLMNNLGLINSVELLQESFDVTLFKYKATNFS